MANKNSKKRNSKKRKSNKFIVVLLVLIVIGICGYFGFVSYKEVEGIKEVIDSIDISLDDNEELTSDINLITEVSENVKINWTSSNNEILTSSGKVNKPDAEEDSVNVTLKGVIEISYKMPFSEMISKYIIDTKEYVYNFTINPTPITKEFKVQKVNNLLTLPTSIYDSITLPTTLCYDDVTVSWTSSNNAILSDSGEVINPSSDTICSLVAKISSEGYEESKTFQIEVLSSAPVINLVDDNFDNQAATTTYKTFTSTSGVIYNNARVIEIESSEGTDETDDLNKTTPTIIKLRNKDDSNGETEDDANIGSFKIENVESPKLFKFDYLFSGTQSKEDSKLVITYTNLLTNEKNTEEVVVKHTTEYVSYEKDLTSYKSVSINVYHIDTWKSDTFINIDNVNVDKKVTIEMVSTSIIDNMPTSLSKSVILPFTSSYGGCVTWTSSSNNLSSNGSVKRSEKSEKVTLTGTISYLGETQVITVEVTIKGKVSSEALEIYFIDIGKYGAGDCGECTYIKFNDVDIIVDAGDNFSDSKQAINEVINKHLTDGVIEYVIATHPDGDHIGGMASLIDTYNVSNLIKFEGTYSTNKYKNMEKAIEDEGCNVYQIKSDIIDQGKASRFIELSNDVYISFVDTKHYENSESNGKSIVFTLNAYGKTVLMTGDADNASGHTDLEASYMNSVGNIDILKVVHHGTANGSSSEFLKAIDPEVAIICNGNYLGNKHGHPTPTAIYNLYNYDSEMKVYCICGGGTVDGVVNTKTLTYKCSSEDRFNQRNGTINVLIDNNGYNIVSEYNSTSIIELKDTTYYKEIKSSGLFDLIK